MSDTLHLVCPSCDRINRIPAQRLKDSPRCGQCGQKIFKAQAISLDDHHFNLHISRNDIPVVVDFWAEWCAPCRMMAPVYAEAAKQLEPLVRFAKLNTEQARMTAAHYNIRAIPTIMLFRQGREAARQAGAMQLSPLLHWIQQHIKGHQ